MSRKLLSSTGHRMGMLVVALEGPSYSGKTTLSRYLLEEFRKAKAVVCPDYVQVAGGENAIPQSPRGSVREEISSFRFFLKVDKLRWKRYVPSTNRPRLVFLDRSIHTLLAHTLAIEILTGNQVFDLACKIAVSQRVRLPQLVLYLEVPSSELNRRAIYRPHRSAPIFEDPVYNEAFRGYFIPKLRWSTSPCVVLKRIGTPESLATTARALIHDRLGLE